MRLAWKDETIAEALRAEARRWNDLSWALDTALSLQHKADPATGYRSSPSLGDAPWDGSRYAAQVNAAAVAGLLALGPYKLGEPDAAGYAPGRGMVEPER
jgi:hypothetical protein